MNVNPPFSLLVPFACALAPWVAHLMTQRQQTQVWTTNFTLYRVPLRTSRMAQIMQNSFIKVSSNSLYAFKVPMHFIDGLILAVQHWAGHINWIALYKSRVLPLLISAFVFICVCARFKCQMKNSLDSWSCAWPTTHFSLEREILQLWLIGKPVTTSRQLHMHTHTFKSAPIKKHTADVYAKSL